MLRAGVVDDVAHAQTTELVNRALKGVAIALADHVKRLIERPANAFIDPDAKRAKADPDALRRAVASAVARAWTATHALLAIPLERKVTSTPEALRAERDELLDVTIPNALAVAVVDLERASATHALASLRVVGALLGYGPRDGGVRGGDDARDSRGAGRSRAADGPAARGRVPLVRGHVG